MEQAVAVRRELATIRLQRLWLNTLYQESKVVDCFVVTERKIVITDQTFAGKWQAEVAFALISSRVQRRDDHVPHFCLNCRFCLAKDARPFENAIALGSIQKPNRGSVWMTNGFCPFRVFICMH
jgi:hypothetical protein